ncbi:MAG: hypothetical protein U5K74_03640 [Gemmatimonadaceae bacterium]|nr:hypothetical protein [Gemmatimonadaceae bacterium]
MRAATIALCTALASSGVGSPAGADRPDRLVGEHHRGDLRLVDAGDARAKLTQHGGFGVARVTLGEELTDAQHRCQPRAEGRLHLEVRLRVRLTEDVPALRMPDQDVRRAGVPRHRRGILARERALVLVMDVLDPDFEVGPLSHQLADGRHRQGVRTEQGTLPVARLHNG